MEIKQRCWSEQTEQRSFPGPWSTSQNLRPVPQVLLRKQFEHGRFEEPNKHSIRFDLLRGTQSKRVPGLPHTFSFLNRLTRWNNGFIVVPSAHNSAIELLGVL